MALLCGSTILISLQNFECCAYGTDGMNEDQAYDCVMIPGASGMATGMQKASSICGKNLVTTNEAEMSAIVCCKTSPLGSINIDIIF